jgi:hypothetical protein
MTRPIMGDDNTRSTECGAEDMSTCGHGAGWEPGRWRAPMQPTLDSLTLVVLCWIYAKEAFRFKAP